MVAPDKAPFTAAQVAPVAGADGPHTVSGFSFGRLLAVRRGQGMGLRRGVVSQTESVAGGVSVGKGAMGEAWKRAGRGARRATREATPFDMRAATLCLAVAVVGGRAIPRGLRRRTRGQACLKGNRGVVGRSR